MKLFAVYVGGRSPSSLIEIHDMHFAFGNHIEETYDQLKAQWWGIPESLHLDAWAPLECIDNYLISLKSEPSKYLSKLFFIYLGGYDPNEFTELHKTIFLVAENEEAAKKAAKAKISHWHLPHTDGLYEMDTCVNVSELLHKKGLFIHLERTQESLPFTFTCQYVPIGKS